MTDRVKHTAGFTLAELMMSIAIILILAAIAIPSIFNAQSNMRMVELNNAAQSIANAAQTQMTAMKVSGTWMAFLDDRAEGSGTYLLRDEARASNILTSLSVDSTVYDGDYVIVFDQDTASVTAVFYTDGKTGFFGQAPATTNAAQTYYAGGSGSTDQTARMANDPMIGYYEGTPSGATPEVALRNPVIWVADKGDTKGFLCVQDPNLDEHSDWQTSTELTLSKQGADGKTATFTIGGLSGRSSSGSTIAVSATVPDGSTITLEFTGSGISNPILKRIDKAGANGGNVYAINLNELVRAVSASEQPGAADLLTVLRQFSKGESVQVSASVVAPSRASVAASALANIEWPEDVARLSVYLTNPYSSKVGAKADHIAGTYKDPIVKTVDEKGNDAATPKAASSSKDNDIKASNTNTALVGENSQAGTQSYSGGWVDMGTAVKAKASLNATTGSYAPDDATKYQYQIWELWVKQGNGDYMRAGYMRNNVWEWADYSSLGACITWYRADGTSIEGDPSGENASDIVSVTVDVEKLQEKLAGDLAALADGSGSVELYLRTAPKEGDVQAYFNREVVAPNEGIDAPIKTDYFSNNNEIESASRRVGSDSSTVARRAFENEFGTSSSDVSWVVTREGKTGDDYSQANDYLKEDSNVRVYYSIAPGIGFDNIKGYSENMPTVLGAMRSTQMTNVALWLYRGESLSSLKAMPKAMLISDGDDPYTCRSGSGGANQYDFKLTTQEDHRFYRVLTYENVQSGHVSPQYVPHIFASDQDIATIADANGYEDDEKIYTLSHWITTDTVSGKELVVSKKDVVSDYSDLANKGTTLTAVYSEQRKGVGVVYVEFDKDGKAVGWAGYTSNSQDKFEKNLAPDGVDIDSFGYYVVVPTGKKPSAQSKDYREKSLILQYEQVDLRLNDVYYDLYRIGGYSSQLVTGYGEMRTSSRTVTYACEGQVASYTFNLNFAAAVALEGDKSVESSDWGTEKAPWLVRHGLQFPGALPANNTSEGVVQANYQSSCFAQNHDIDMASTTITNANKYEWTFKGVYDGNGYAVKNLHSRFLAANADITIKDGTSLRAWGLFSATYEAAIRNVRIVESNDAVWSMKGTNGFSVGLLVGSAEKGSIENCTVEGENAVVAITSSPRNGQTNCGGLVGRASDLTLSGCYVKDITIVLTSNGAWVNEPAMGGLVGYLSNTNIASLNEEVWTAVSKVSLVIETAPSASKSLRFGGIAGLADNLDGDEKINNCIAHEVKMTAPSMDEKIRGQVLFGTYLGSYVGSGNPIVSSGTVSDAQYRFGEEEYGPVTKMIGDAESIEEEPGEEPGEDPGEEL